ncbi:MAG: AlpA family phage regulatory protein [Anaerolineae bacterium]|nr:AlpA family phage regulatory protein [Anaerolineae bacterium]
MAKAILRIPAVCSRIGLSRSSVYDRLNPSSKSFDPSFPRPISIGPRSVGFVEEEIDRWIDQRIEQSRLAA